MKNPILNLLLLMLRILLYLSPNADYKGGRFSKTLPKKGVEFVLSKEDSTIKFNLGFLLLPAEIDSISKKQGYKRVALGTCGVKMVFALLTKVVTLYIGAII